MTIDLGSIIQGEEGSTLTFAWEYPTSLTAPASISGATITATKTNLATGETTAVTGTLTGTGAAAATWVLSAADAGTAGAYRVLFKAVTGGATTYSMAANLYIVGNPAVTAVAAPAVVGISQDLATWLEAEEAGVNAAADGELLQSDGTNSEGSGITATSVSSHIASNSNPHSVTAAQVNAVPEDAAIISKSAAYELAAGDEAKIIEVTATALITCPDGLDAGFQVAIVPIGGTVTLTAATTLQYFDSGLQTAGGALTVNAPVVVYHRGSNVWLVTGDVSA